MTKITRWLSLTALVGLAIVGGLWLGLTGSEDAPAPHAPAADPPLPGGIHSPNAGALATDVEHRELLRAPAVQSYQARLTFVGDYQSFIAGAANLSEEERHQRAAALAEEIDRREAAGELALSEALLLQVGLAQAEGGDEEAQKARANALMSRYQALSAERAKRGKTVDARFAQYKSDEKRIVEEVMTMDSIPDGLSRDQYLRQRLQQAREQAYQ